MLRSYKCWWFLKEPVVMCGNWNVRQATSQQLFKVTTFCTDTRFQSFSPLINCIVHYAVLKFSACCNKTLPQLVRSADWYSMHALLKACPRRGNLPGWGQDCWLAWCQDWWTGVSHGAEARLSQARCAGALSCWKTNMSPAKLRIAGSSVCISNTTR